jgi:hypothetical protein
MGLLRRLMRQGRLLSWSFDQCAIWLRSSHLRRPVLHRVQCGDGGHRVRGHPGGGLDQRRRGRRVETALEAAERVSPPSLPGALVGRSAIAFGGTGGVPGGGAAAPAAAPAFGAAATSAAVATETPAALRR